MNGHIIQQRKKAFTVIELVVIIVVIGILATISLFAIRSWRDGVAETGLKNDLNGVKAALENAKNWSKGSNNGYPSLTTGTTFDGSDTTAKKLFTQSSDSILVYAEGSKEYYCIDAASKTRENIFLFLDSRQGSEPKKGTCAGGEGAAPVPTGSGITLFTFDLNAYSCGNTIYLPITSPTSDSNSTIYWGDGATEVRTGAMPSHTYTKKGVYTVGYKGAITIIDGSSVPYDSRMCMTGVKQWSNTISPTKISRLGTNTQYVAEPPRTVTDMSNMFMGANFFNQPLNHWDVSNVTNMESMFYYAMNFNQPLNNWNVSNVTDMSYMFGYSYFDQDVSGWNVSSVTNWSGFAGMLRAVNMPPKFR